MNERPLPTKKRECLIVCGDAAAKAALHVALQSLMLSGHFAYTVEQAVPALETERFGIVVLDGDLAGAQEFMAVVRDYCVRTNAISVVLQPLENSFLRGATLVGAKPLTVESAKQYLRSALNLTRPPRRRTIRICVEPLVHVTCNENTERGQIIDISETGIAVRGQSSLPMGSDVTLRLLLPGMKNPLEVTGTVSRIAADRTGIRFGDFATEDQEEQLRDWLSYVREYSRRAPEPVKVTAADHPGNAAMANVLRHHRATHRRPEPQRSSWGRMWRTIVSG